MDENDILLSGLGIAEAARAIRDGETTSEALVRACLTRIEEAEPVVQAWAYLDSERALEQACMADEIRSRGLPSGPLLGVPIGIKDIVDTVGMPTENGTILDAGRTPGHNAVVVDLLRQAGAVIMGKTVTTELAVYAPGKTRNPHDPTRTPGGSSSGSAAAVASMMVPGAIGTQTNGSVIRPAAFCGVFGYKPTHGLIPRPGVLDQSRFLDVVGVFARSIEDLALLAEQMMAYDPRDPDTRPDPRPPLSLVAAQEAPVTPRLAFVKTPVWPQGEDDMKEAFAELTDFLGTDIAFEVALPDIYNDALKHHRTIVCADIAKNYGGYYKRGKSKLSPTLVEMIEEGQRCLAVDYMMAQEWAKAYVGGFDELFAEFDAIITPSASGQAPKGLDRTGSPAFCTLWSLTGMPAVNLPLLAGNDGLPIGVQLVGPRGGDARLLRAARWLCDHIAANGGD